MYQGNLADACTRPYVESVVEGSNVIKGSNYLITMSNLITTFRLFCVIIGYNEKQAF